MTTEQQANPVVFISYAWTSEEYRQRIIHLATELRTNWGVNVRLDAWDLKPGQDAYSFMESMVTDPSVQYVIIACNPEYARKANMRDGGVGTETQIITPQLYSDTAQTKFIPVIMDKNGDGSLSLPTFLSGRVYIDMAGGIDNIEDLARHIYNEHRQQRPALGPRPTFGVLTDGPTTHQMLVEQAVRAGRANSRGRADVTKQALRALTAAVADLRAVPSSQSELEEAVLRKVDESVEIRNSFVSLVISHCQVSSPDDPFHEFSDFFESAKRARKPSGRHYVAEFDPPAYCILELFLHYVSILIDQRRLDAVSSTLSDEYVVNGKSHSFTCLAGEFALLPESTRGAGPRHRWNDYVGTLLKERETSLVPFASIQQTDFLLFIAAKFRAAGHWPPHTAVYRGYATQPFDVFVGAKGDRRMAILHAVLGVDGLEDLREKSVMHFSKNSSLRVGFGWGSDDVSIIEAMNLATLFPETFGKTRHV